MMTYPVHQKGSTGTGRAFINGLQDTKRLCVEFEVEAIGATPTVTFQVEGLYPGGASGTATDWAVLALKQADDSVAASNAPITVTAVGKTRRYVVNFDVAFFDAIAVNVTANTNVTYSSRFTRSDDIA